MKEFLSPPKKKIPFSQKFLGKTKFHIRKPLECSVGGVWTRWGIYGLIVFFCGVVVFHFHPASNQKFQSQFEKKETGVSQLAYLFYDAEGNVYDVFGTQGEHGVPQSWEYLFEGVEVMTGNDESAPEIQVPVQEETQFSTGSQSSSVSATGTVSTLPKPSDSLPADGEPENVDLPVAKVFPYAEKGVV
ncbi:MAG: hypothetical protein LBU27_07160 [Candidatus Peribacteria bacterium]|jgi:hypothetical protein|nr:hypothetical protein [Candidatus Peribacteria bacterium]